MSANASTGLPRGRDSRLRRHNRALMELSRRLWHDDLGLDQALAAITETGADILDVERVNVWELEPSGSLRCVHGYERGARAHNPIGYDERRVLDDSASVTALRKARVVHAADMGEASEAAAAVSPLKAYFHRHRIRSLLDAPVRISDGMYGVICHEQVGNARVWQPDEVAFAGNMGDFVALAVEIDRRKRAEAAVDYLQLYDAVSGLGNRKLFHAAVDELLLRMRRRPRLAAVLFIDIDRFCNVNTNAGEVGGDAMLGALGDRICNITPDDAVVTRVESDCFGVLLPRLDHEWQAARLAEDIIATIAEHAETGPQQFDIGASIGVAYVDGSRPLSSEEWLRDADFASKQAKERGRNRYEVFDADQHRSVVERMLVEYALRDAFKNRQLAVAYQPEVDVRRGVMVAAEALLRWRQPDGSLRVAGEFIDVAESSGLIVPIGWWVLQHACSEAAAWPQAADGVTPMLRVNLSARQFEQPDLADRVATILRESGLAPQRLCLELTETTLMTRAESALETLRQLRTLGISLAIDDFGTGYSSLTYLRRFPIDTLKIDRSFVEGLPDSSFDLAIVEAVVGLAHTLGIEVVAEGVERIEQQQSLQRFGLHRMQGWLYAKALDQPALLEFAAQLRPTDPSR